MQLVRVGRVLGCVVGEVITGAETPPRPVNDDDTDFVIDGRVRKGLVKGVEQWGVESVQSLGAVQCQLAHRPDVVHEEHRFVLCRHRQDGTSLSYDTIRPLMSASHDRFFFY